MRLASSIRSTVSLATACCSASGQGTEVEIDGIEYLVMKESDIMGVLVEASAGRKAA
jgi:co-chaperonin GroES (HSP10)